MGEEFEKGTDTRYVQRNPLFCTTETNTVLLIIYTQIQISSKPPQNQDKLSPGNVDHLGPSSVVAIDG